MRFCEASAKDNFNVDEIFLKLVDDILSKVQPKNYWMLFHLYDKLMSTDNNDNGLFVRAEDQK